MSTTTARDARIAALLRKAADELDPAVRPARKAPAKKVAAKVAPAAKAKAQAKSSMTSEEFVTWVRDTAEARAERKATNAVLAAALRKAGINPSGAAWEAAKAAPSVKAAVKAARAAA